MFIHFFNLYGNNSATKLWHYCNRDINRFNTSHFHMHGTIRTANMPFLIMRDHCYFAIFVNRISVHQFHGRAIGLCNSTLRGNSTSIFAGVSFSKWGTFTMIAQHRFIVHHHHTILYFHFRRCLRILCSGSDNNDDKR